jgi:2-keto-3-deoxy-L-rhamnonate aldolase RhmA
MIRKNRVREALKNRNLALGTWVQMKNSEACELAAAVGYDFVVIDMEHGSFGWEGAVDMVRAVECEGATPMIRLPGDSPDDIKKALDAGALGVIIPRISTPEQASQVVQAAKYEPSGKRGACPVVRATSHGLLDWKAHRRWADENVMVWGIIETVEAVQNLAEILTQGLDAIALGPFDLSMSMGLGGDPEHPKVKREISRLADMAFRKGVDFVVTLFALEPAVMDESARFWIKKGCRLMTTSSDRAILSHSHQRMFRLLQELKK